VRHAAGPGAGIAAPSGVATTRATLPRRLGALVYESLLVVALVLVTGFLLAPLISPGARADGALALPSTVGRLLSFAGVAGTAMLYCVWCWSEGRRSLPMKTWRLALRTRDGGPVSVRRATVRYLACWIGPVLAVLAYLALSRHGLGAHAAWLVAFNFLWAAIDPERQFLHDRLAGTCIVDEPDSPRLRRSRECDAGGDQHHPGDRRGAEALAEHEP
jgi:uncharacterized RDD family membrane protein YckC